MYTYTALYTVKSKTFESHELNNKGIKKLP